MNTILIVNGPNLNLLGSREAHIYGNKSFESYLENLKSEYQQFNLHYHQSNIEGELIDILHREAAHIQGVIINAGAYTHTSIALADALKAIDIPYVEVHISNVANREPYRHTSYLSAAAAGCIFGFGLESYRLALEFFSKKLLSI